MNDSQGSNGNFFIFLDCDGVINCERHINEWIAEHGTNDLSIETFKKKYYRNGGFDGYVTPELLERLNRLCEETDAKIVWSSSWREEFEIPSDNHDGISNFHVPGIEMMWNAKGLPFSRYAGCTDVVARHRMSYVPRYVEIGRWLDRNMVPMNITRVAILDDDYDAWVPFGGKYSNVAFFQTTIDDGLTEEIASRVRKWLVDGMFE